MADTPTEPPQHGVDISEFATGILADEDRLLFDEAVKSARIGALRAAYLMIWLSCAESIKRRFTEAQQRDHVAGQIVGDIADRENNHRGVDKFLIAKSFEYGFTTDSENQTLNHIYDMRCIYAHPYNEAPSEQQLIHAASSVVECLLSKLVKHGKGFGSRLIKDLIENDNFLDHYAPTITAYADEVLPRIDERIYGWLFNSYLRELEKIHGDPSMRDIYLRGVFFCQQMLKIIGVDFFSAAEWHAKVNQFPGILGSVCGLPDIFGELGSKAQDSYIGFALEESNTRPRVLAIMEALSVSGVLSKRHEERFANHTKKMDIESLSASGLSIRVCYNKIIEALKVPVWYTQNPALDLALSKGPDGLEGLSTEQQEMLGRNFLQAGEGSAHSARDFFRNFEDSIMSWPLDFVRGIAFECFTNEKHEIRFKTSCLDDVLSALDSLEESRRESIIREAIESITKGKPKFKIQQREVDGVIALLNKYAWAADLSKCIAAEISEDNPF